ncbi:MAG: nuclear transport factor 2 family protein [Paracoccaceae bacterium]
MSYLENIEAWFKKVWVDQDLDGIEDSFTHPDAAGGLQGLSLSPEDFRELVPAMRALFNDPKVTTLRAVETGDWLWMLVQVTGISAQDGRDLSFTGQVAMRFEGDKIAEAYNHFDFISFFEQIGALPEETIALCLSGEQLQP